MAGADRQYGSWKEKFFHEMAEYGINVIYLALVFAAFTQYRRLVLAAHDIIYTNYWVAVIQALILGKVIMIGAVFHAGRGLERRPLIYPTLYKALIFTLMTIAKRVRSLQRPRSPKGETALRVTFWCLVTAVMFAAGADLSLIHI